VREWKGRRGRIRGTGKGKEVTREGLREEERGPRAERRGRESDGKNQ